MTEEQIEQNAEEYAKEHYDIPFEDDSSMNVIVSEESYIAGAHSLDEEIKELNARIVKLMCERDSIKSESEYLINKLRNPWISVEERLPEEPLTICAVWLKGDDLVPHISLYDSGRFLLLPVDVTVTHWMPIPETPLNK